MDVLRNETCRFSPFTTRLFLEKESFFRLYEQNPLVVVTHIFPVESSVIEVTTLPETDEVSFGSE
ncbi:MAG TPA: hypothetical protein VMT63_01390 [Bacteroidales bacterium]|nr:hypothetical protein [Bacteroidales bacterium]